MSKSQSRKRKSRALSSDTMAMRVMGSLLLIAFGVLLFMAVNLRMVGDIFTGLRMICYGSAGNLAFFVFLLPLVTGVLLLISTQKKVRLRVPLMSLLCFLLLLGSVQLLTYTSMNGRSLPLMDYLALQTPSRGGFQDMLHQAYLFGSETGSGRAGGLLGMLLAWPLWKSFGAVFSGILCILGILAVLMCIFHIHPLTGLRRLQDRLAASSQAREAREYEQQQEEIQYQQQMAARQAMEQQHMQQIQQQRQAQPATAARPAVNMPHRQTAQRAASQAGIPATPEESMVMEASPLRKATLAFSKIFGRQEHDEQAAAAPVYRRQVMPDPQPEVNPFMQTAPVTRTAAAATPAQPVQPAQTFADPPLNPDPQIPAWAYPADELAAMQAADPAEQTTSPVRAEAPVVHKTEHRKASTPAAATPATATSDPDVNPFMQAVERGTLEVQPPVRTSRTESESAPAAATAGQRQPTAWQSAVTEKIQELDDDEDMPPALQKPMDSWTDAPVMNKAPKKVEGTVVMPVTSGSSVWDPQLEIKEAEGTTYGGNEIVAEPKPEPVPYVFPSLSFLKQPEASVGISPEEDAIRAQRLEETLASFRIQAQVKNVTHGPAISRFELELAAGIKVSKVTDLGPNIAMNMAVKSVRIEAPIPGKSLVGVEIPNPKVATVTLREVLESEPMVKSKEPLLVALGRDIAGAPIVCNLAKMPHLLIAGATGSGKSVCINAIINSLVYRCTPQEVRMILVDPKVVELQCYNGIPHLLSPVVSDPHKAAGALQWAVDEMMHRYNLFTKAGVRNIGGYNSALAEDEEPMPRIVIIIDELADLMMTCKREVEEHICRIAQLARAAGIHLVVATQRPSVDVITGLIKANIPSRIAFKVSSFTDSRTILDRNGAEQLLGYGDMLYQPMGEFTPTRVQGCFLSDPEVNQVADFIRAHSVPDYDPNVLEQLSRIENDTGMPAPDMAETVPDDGSGDASLLSQCIEMAINDGQVSTSLIQRRMKIGYARAGRLVDEMEKRGIISAKDGAKPRMCLISREEYENLKANGSLSDLG